MAEISKDVGLTDVVGDIGSTAGKVYTALSKTNGPTELEELNRVVNSNGVNYYMALGWLAREDKLGIDNVNGTIMVKLKGSVGIKVPGGGGDVQVDSRTDIKPTQTGRTGGDDVKTTDWKTVPSTAVKPAGDMKNADWKTAPPTAVKPAGDMKNADWKTAPPTAVKPAGDMKNADWRTAKPASGKIPESKADNSDDVEYTANTRDKSTKPNDDNLRGKDKQGYNAGGSDDGTD